MIGKKKETLHSIFRGFGYELVKMVIVLVVFCFVAILAGGTFNLIRTNRVIQKEVGTHLADLAKDTADQISNDFHQRIRYFSILSRSDLLESKTVDIEAESKLMREVVESDPVFKEMLFIQTDGLIRAANRRELIGVSLEELDREGAQFLRQKIAFKQGVVFVEEPRWYAPTNALSYCLVTPIVDEDTLSVIGWLRANLSIEPVVHLFEELKKRIPQSEEPYLLRESGHILLGPDLRYAFSPHPDAGIGEFALRLESAEDGTLLYTNNRGEKMLSGFARLDRFGQNEIGGWVVIVSLPYSVAFEQSLALKRQNLILLIVVTLAILAFGYLVIRRVMVPLNQIASFAAGAARGKVEEPVSLQMGGEFGLLATAFERLTFDLKKSHEELVRSEKMSALGQLAGVLAHELRNPLGVMRNSIYYLSMKLDSQDEKVKKHLEMLEQEVKISEKIIQDTLGFVRIKPPAQGIVEVNKILQEALVNSNLPQDIEVSTHFAEGIDPVRGDATQLLQVFTNIITNAGQAMPTGGKFYLFTEGMGDRVRIDFQDSGSGISPEQMKKLFKPFFTTKPKGTGLGLAVCYDIIKAHQGQIEVESAIGKGTTFKITLPLIKEGQEQEKGLRAEAKK